MVMRKDPWRVRKCEKECDAKKTRKTYAKAGRENKSTTTLYMKCEKLPLGPNTTHTGVHGKLQHFRPDHNRVWGRSVQLSVTKIVDIL